MAHTPLSRLLRTLAAEVGLAQRTGRSFDEVHAQADAQRRSRRQFLATTGGLLAATVLPSVVGCGSDTGTSKAGSDAGSGDTSGGKSAPRIAIIGAGIAGLTAAVTLQDAGIAATVYEVSKVGVGGRMKSQRQTSKTACNVCHAPPPSASDMAWDDGQVTDIYGELIDTSHETIRALAERYKLPLVDALGAAPSDATETFYVAGGYYTLADAAKDFAAIYDALQQDATDAGYPTTYDSNTEKGRALDNMSVYDWIEKRVPGGHTSRLGKLLDATYSMEYGSDTKDQSSLNLVYMLAGSAVDDLKVLGESDEKYRFVGGNNQLPTAMAASLGGAVKLGWDFQAIAKASDGSYTLTFDHEGAEQKVSADHVLLAIPFTKLRTLDYDKAGFDAKKKQAIAEQGGGKNGKLHLQFTKRLWNEAGPWGKSTGTAYTDLSFQLTWDPTRGQTGKSGILVAYTGGSLCDAQKIAHPYGNINDPNVKADAKTALADLEKLFPGIGATWNGKAAATMAHLDKRFLCSYAYWKVGQCQAFAGYEKVRQGNVYFAGEHTSVDFLGFMEGGAAEGKRAGEEILKSIKG